MNITQSEQKNGVVLNHPALMNEAVVDMWLNLTYNISIYLLCMNINAEFDSSSRMIA